MWFPLDILVKLDISSQDSLDHFNTGWLNSSTQVIQVLNFCKMRRVKYTEKGDLVDRGTFRGEHRTELPDIVTLVAARYTVTIKSQGYKEQWYKVRYIVGGNLDIVNDHWVHRARTIQSVSLRMALVEARIKVFGLWVDDIKLAHLQFN